MLKWMNRIVNAALICTAAAFIGYAAYVFWHYKTFPDYYFPQSAPWYTGILLYGVFAGIFTLICIVIKLVVKRKLRQ